MSLRLFSLLREFASERRGNVAIIFAFALIPIIGFVGAAIDYSRGNVVKVEMQSALDSVGLMLYKTAPTLSVDQLQSAAQSYFLAVFAGRYGANNIKVSATYSTTGVQRQGPAGRCDPLRDWTAAAQAYLRIV
jgi:Flp pilus assembly protein TadG